MAFLDVAKVLAVYVTRTLPLFDPEFGDRVAHDWFEATVHGTFEVTEIDMVPAILDSLAETGDMVNVPVVPEPAN
jgi:hypothetical protein